MTNTYKADLKRSLEIRDSIKQIEVETFKDLIARLIENKILDAETLEDELNAVDIADKLTRD